MTTLANASTMQSFLEFASQNWTDVVSSTFGGVDAGSLTAAQRAAMLAQALEKQAMDLMQEAARYGQQADALGDAAGSRYWNDVALKLNQQAIDVSRNANLEWIESTFKTNIADVAKAVGGAVDLAEITVDVATAVTDNNWDPLGQDSAGLLGAIAAGAAAAALIALLPVTVPAALAGVFVGAVAFGGDKLGEYLFEHSVGAAREFFADHIFGGIDRLLSGLFKNLETTQYRIVWIGDPLALDLDGDGIETVGENGASSVMFDHDGDGLKTATGWVKSDDGFLVLDRNNNGIIDSGQELFGDQTRRPDGTVTPDGFAALADQDTNADGVVNANDTTFSSLRIWRDLNQDGISQTSELQTLAQAGVQSLSLTNTQVDQTLADGNTIHRTGTYTKTDGSTYQLADLELNENPLYRQFTDTVAIPTTIASLPNLQGTGRLRDLQQAASLSPALADLLNQYANATTATAQQALLDDLITAWVDTALPYAPPPIADDTSAPLFKSKKGKSGSLSASYISQRAAHTMQAHVLKRIISPLGLWPCDDNHRYDAVILKAA